MHVHVQILEPLQSCYKNIEINADPFNEIMFMFVTVIINTKNINNDKLVISGKARGSKLISPFMLIR